MARWDDAHTAAVRRQQQEQTAAQQLARQQREERDAEARQRREEELAYEALKRRMATVATQLEDFLRSPDGISAKRFLGQVQKSVSIGYNYAGGGYGQAIILDSRGLISSTEPHGTGLAYGRAADRARVEAERQASQHEAPAVDAVRYFTVYNKHVSKGEPEGMVDWLKREIDKLAQPYTGS